MNDSMEKVTSLSGDGVGGAVTFRAAVKAESKVSAMREKLEALETPERIAAREYLTVGDLFGGPNRIYTLSESVSLVESSEVKPEVQERFMEWFSSMESAGRSEFWGHSIRGVARSWYWENAGIDWSKQRGMSSETTK